MSEEEVYTADEVRDIVDRVKVNEDSAVDNVGETFEEYATVVVESGTMSPDCEISTELSLTLRERITGKRTQNLSAIFTLGMMLGTALERDVPKDSALEDAWRDGAFTLPDDERQ